jgi:phosphohistidine phosphatase
VAPRLVVLVHHAEAVGPGVDPERPLSVRGHTQVLWLSERAKDAGLRPAIIWHSGKLRARQTAEAFLRACNPAAQMRMVRGLRPDDPPDWVEDALLAEDREVLVVSHMPLLPALLRRLLSSAADFPVNGLVALERTGEREWVERWRLAPPREHAD